MKKIILCVVMALSLHVLNTASAQNNNREQMQQAYRQYLKDSVNLQDAMVDSVMAIRSEFRPQMREIFQDQSTSMDDKQSKMQDVRKQMEARYKTAGLTDEQVQMIHQHDEQMMNRMRGRMNNGGQ
ncbi:MAG: hypothetical protein ACTHJ5_15735 [Ilyomonas sp.]